MPFSGFCASRTLVSKISARRLLPGRARRLRLELFSRTSRRRTPTYRGQKSLTYSSIHPNATRIPRRQMSCGPEPPSSRSRDTNTRCALAWRAASSAAPSQSRTRVYEPKKNSSRRQTTTTKTKPSASAPALNTSLAATAGQEGDCPTFVKCFSWKGARVDYSIPSAGFAI